MAFIIDYIDALNASKLKASEVSKCLLYLNSIATRNPEMEPRIPTRKVVNKRLQALRKAKRAACYRKSSI